MNVWLDIVGPAIFMIGCAATAIWWFRIESSRSRFRKVRRAVKNQEIAEDMSADQFASRVTEYVDKLRMGLLAFALMGSGAAVIAIAAFRNTEPASMTAFVLCLAIAVRFDTIVGERRDALDFLDFVESVDQTAKGRRLRLV